ncbi:carbohydrate ABC transporter permease [Nonomuraea sediminis]|uniref:carbohydrate ABC transporter permease n=1 Tax=Nonomuraea sediminis TaxID=2835864 RepID=UPI001BDCAC37|nr:sugar ABC transporter permease [Nonomuraea sediminis]
MTTQALTRRLASRKTRTRRRGRWHAYLFIGPSLFGVVAFLILPVVIVFVLSFFDWELLSDPTFVGLDNYRKMAGDGSVWSSLGITVAYVLLCVPLQTVLALGLALLANQKVRGVKFFRALFVVPWMATPMVLGLVWSWIFDPKDGAINQFLDLFGITGPAWLSETSLALPAVALVHVWQNTGYNMLFFLAGLQGIPQELYDAAACDGATPRQRFWRVTLPLLNPTMFFVTVTNMIGAFQAFDTIYSMTAGGPSESTSVINYKIFHVAFKEFDFGYASTLSLVLFLVILLVTLTQVRFFGKRTTYDLS